MALIGRALISLQRTSADSIKVARDDRDHYRELWLIDQRNYTKEVAGLRAELRLVEAQLDMARETKAELQQQLDHERTERKEEKTVMQNEINSLRVDKERLEAQVKDLQNRVNELTQRL